MTLAIGIDLGTSGIKAVLIEDGTRVIGQASRPIAVSIPHVGWSEQNADDWVSAAFACLDDLAAAHPGDMGAVAGIGLSGQMLAALVLGRNLKPLRPAILWNDQRAQAECRDLLDLVPDIGLRTNGTPDPGITAPKLMWLARHEPDVTRAARMLLLTKDYVRLALTGEVATEPTDAGGTQLFDVAADAWDGTLCAAAGWDAHHLPPVTRAWVAAGGLRPALATRWGLKPGLPVATGAGDNMGSTLGAGGARPGDAVLTIGTSAVACLVDHAFHPGPGSAILTGAHAVPGTWSRRRRGQLATPVDAIPEPRFVRAGRPIAIAAFAFFFHHAEVSTEKLLSSDEPVRIAALQRVGKLPVEKQKKLFPSLIKALHDPESKIVNRSLDAMGAMSIVAFPYLIPVFSDEDPFVRLSLAGLCKKMGPEAAPLIPNLIILLQDQHPLVKEEAAVALSKMGALAEKAVPELIKNLSDTDPDVKASAAIALSKIGTPPALAALVPPKKKHKILSHDK